MIFERTQCPICEGKALTKFLTVSCKAYAAHDPAFPDEKTWLRCEECLHLFSRLAWTRETFRESLKRPVFGDDDTWDDRRYMNAYDCIRMMNDLLDTPRTRVLEVGCGKAYLSGAAKDQGLTALALDPHPTFKKYADRIGCSFVGSFIEDFDAYANDDLYDIITLADVLEHCEDPRQVLRKLPYHAKTILYLSTPLYDLSFYRVTRWGTMFTVTDHQHFFSIASLYRLVREEGWEVVHHTISESYRGCCEWILARSSSPAVGSTETGTT